MTNLLSRTKLSTMLFLERKEHFHKFIEENHAGIYVADDQGNLVYVNSAFVSILGYSKKDDLLGKNLAKELYVDSQEREKFLKAMEHLGFVKDYEVRNKRKDGSVVVLSVTSNWVKDDADHIIGVEGIVHDITQKRMLEKALEKDTEKLAEILNFEESLSLIHDVNKIGDFAVKEIAGILEAQKCSMMLYDHEKEDLFILAAKGLEESTIRNTRVKMGEKIAGVVAQKREPTLVLNIEYDAQFARANKPYYPSRSFMSVPIVFGPKFLGVINVADKLNKTWRVFTDTDLKLLCLMSRAVAIALENAKLFRQIEVIPEGTLWTRIPY